MILDVCEELRNMIKLIETNKLVIQSFKEVKEFKRKDGDWVYTSLIIDYISLDKG